MNKIDIPKKSSALIIIDPKNYKILMIKRSQNLSFGG